MKKLPIGLDYFQDFATLNSIYVDKTEYIVKLLNSGGKTFFLSRPRRFGKSLLLSTIKAVFEGRKELFKGLYIEDKIDWEPHPVIKLDMSLNARNIATITEGLKGQLLRTATTYDLTIPYEDPAAILAELIAQLKNKTNKPVVVLVDEYDKPILDVIDDPEQAAENRQFLQSFYVILKASSASIKFLMLTGVSKISQASIFSGLNNLNDISLNTRYAGICGYTQQELEEAFEGYIRQLSETFNSNVEEMLLKIRYWYNGYSWDGKTSVYNPYSVLLLFDKNMFQPFWFHTGTPTFLLKLLEKNGNLDTIVKEKISVPLNFSDGQALEDLDTTALMFQSGYLTIKSYDADGGKYELQFPNEEVRRTLSESILKDLSGTGTIKLHELVQNIKEGFAAGDTAWAIENLDILLANTSHNTHQPNLNESHYQSLFQLVMIMAGVDHRAESTHRNGRTDAVLIFDKHVYAVELKYAATRTDFPTQLAKAMGQIKRQEYAKPYLNQGKKVHLLALAFTKDGVGFEEEVI